MGIVITHLSHVYMKGTPYAKLALTDINLEIPSGAYVGVIGATGSGKSTLVQHIAGLLRPTSGQIQIGDTEITPDTKDLSMLRGRVGVVFQYPEHQLFEETVAKDVAFGPRNLGLPSEEIERRVIEALEWVGLAKELASRSPFQLSGGQMRRAAIAGVLAMHPDVLILDEPTAGLDPAGQRELLNRIYTLHRERKMTVILVSHSMDDVARYAETLFVMAGGRVVLRGSTEGVLQQADRLREWDLGEPEAARIAGRLNQRLDPPLRLDRFTPESLIDAVLERVKKGERG
ncbi:energy-coupling factor transporter ATPase [Desmospora profundinema]|uniref:Energy-coupling factor transporter ATP-binding protein EcfA2 n=1 Tax=Desmospora profundinema TaxID=1571184 RepID=A0ABU1IQE2_9BACL|nr:energy-coupling factor transporter ATPase [Desmospora profundinema]MDR6226926.1 energy-coupling factor transport system ATP-binding protein [Desmospora profundinema]